MESAYKSAKPSVFYDSLKVKQETKAIVVKDPPKSKDFSNLPIREFGICALVFVLVLGFIVWILE